VTLAPPDGKRLQRCLASGGVAVFPTDTVYGIGCDPECEAAVQRVYELKGRPLQQPAAVMFFSLDAALRTLPKLAECERAALRALLPGPVTLLLPNRNRRFPLACAGDPDTLGLRVPDLPALSAVDAPVMQSSANVSGGADARHLADVPASLRDGADLVLDGGELPGTASTVVDLRGYERSGAWRIVRAGPVGPGDLERALG
jgi:L-threonylcarbamoyladenylate synthase